MEGQDLLCLVKSRIYNAELRSDIAKMGLRRINNNQWVSISTAAKYELVMADEGENKVVVGVDIVDKEHRIRVVDSDVQQVMDNALESALDSSASALLVSQELRDEFEQQFVLNEFYFELIDQWNYEIEMDTDFGRELSGLTANPILTWEDFFFLPDPMASGRIVFATIRQGEEAAKNAWLELPDNQYVVPTDGTPEGALDSLRMGCAFHRWEYENFDTPAAAGQYAIKAINASKTAYADAIKSLMQKEGLRVTRNDFYRNKDGQMCRVEVNRLNSGLSFCDVLVVPMLADCIESLISPYVKAKALSLM